MTDIRIINTKNRIRMGMINALKEKPLNEVTTKDIIEAAEVSRKTFYTYYNDQNDLLFEIENAMISDLVEGMKKDREAVTQLDDTTDQVEIAKLADQ
ncbi:MAG: TetR/AcrR family transcriptional regulator, partial [Lactobacillus johnsonii]|nr:TetR/AcrR family transcriptional regulator [Lactobacillus johnsonii]